MVVGSQSPGVQYTYLVVHQMLPDDNFLTLQSSSKRGLLQSLII